MKLAIFHHCVISGGERPIDTDQAIGILAEQMAALKESGLLAEADEFHIGVNGDEADALVVASLCPCDKAEIIIHGPASHTELSTLHRLQQWLPGHQGWRVLYTHSKGASYPMGETFAHAWRRCMERGVVWNWRECMAQMDKGVESCGCHWLTPERFGACVKTPFWGGTFWWATADYLMTLPALPEDTWSNRYEAEAWIGRGPRRPKVYDFHPQWPGPGCAA